MRGVSPGARELNLRTVRDRKRRRAQAAPVPSPGIWSAGGGGGARGVPGDQWAGAAGGRDMARPRLITMSYDKDGRWVGAGVS